MNQRFFYSALILVFMLSLVHLGMSRNNQSQYDEEARQEERLQKSRKTKQPLPSPAEAAKRFVTGVKEVAVDSPAGLITETAESTRDSAPIVGTLEGARKGTESILDNTVKGAVKVATLGYGNVEHYDVEQPKADSSGDTTKIRIKIPGT